MTIIDSLAQKIAFRGGISIGVGTYTEKLGFYGPVLQQAHYLESKVAQYPRIVFGKHLLPSLHAQAVNTFSPDDLARFLAEEATLKSWICTDNEGWHFIDFIGQGMRDLINTGDSDSRLQAIRNVQNAYVFVCSEEKMFQEEQRVATDEKEKKAKETLYQRYKTLREYMDGRLGLWGLSPNIQAQETT